MVNASSTARVTAVQVVDPRFLGRPVHRLAEVAQRLHDDLERHWIQPFNRRHHAGLSLQELRFGPVAPTSQRWTAYAADAGTLQFTLDRAAALCLLGYRYGLTREQLPAACDPAAVGETSTEERLVRQLGRQWLALLLARCRDGLEATPAGSAMALPESLGAGPAPVSGWQLSFVLHDTETGIGGRGAMVLDLVWMERLFRWLEPVRSRRTREPREAARPFPHRLGLTLTARLLQQEMPLGRLLDLEVGQVLPVRLGATDVLIDDARLFTATVAERQGKLCLTSFQDSE